MWALPNENWIQPQKACGSDVLVPHEELVRLLKDRGPDSLMDLLKRNIRSNDPDLQPRHSPYGRMCIFILQNSAWSPLGFDFFMRDKTKALEQFPKEVGELTATLSRWRAALRA